LELPDEL